ncbi:MAG: hypothetical protein ABIJ14_00650 [Nanoarchaeota archaeon]
MEFKKNKKLWGVLITATVLVLIASSTILVAGNSTIINSEILNNTLENIFEVVSQIEVWANTFIDIKQKEDTADVVLYLDDGTSLPNQEIEFYLNNSLIDSKITDSEGYAELIFNPNISSGTYFFKAEFKGNPSLYLNPSFAEEQIEIIRLNETNRNITILNETNQSLLTIYTDKNYYVQNETINIFGKVINLDIDEIALKIKFNETFVFNTNISSTEDNYIYSLIADFEEEGEYIAEISAGNLSAQTDFYFSKTNYTINLDGMICREFTDNVLFSSGYTHNKKGSTNYETWKIQTNCEDAGGQNCLLYNVNTKSRILYASPYDDFTGEGSVQISEVDNSNCDNPEEKEYLKYIVRDTPKEDGGKWERYCEKTKTQDSKCELENSENYYKESTCYGIKTFASQYSIVDVVEIKYTWCWDDSYGDNYEDVKKGNRI